MPEDVQLTRGELINLYTYKNLKHSSENSILRKISVRKLSSNEYISDELFLLVSLKLFHCFYQAPTAVCRVSMSPVTYHGVPALRGFWDLIKFVLRKIRVSGTEVT
jgi:hypothetical protein